MGEIISGRTHLLDGKIKHQKVVVIKPNYFTQELGLTTCSGHKVTKGIDSNYLEVIKASDFFSKNWSHYPVESIKTECDFIWEPRYDWRPSRALTEV